MIFDVKYRHWVGIKKIHMDSTVIIFQHNFLMTKLIFSLCSFCSFIRLAILAPFLLILISSPIWTVVSSKVKEGNNIYNKSRR